MEWLNYHHLHYFWMIAREGTIARAAQRLHLTQPTVSKQLAQLEQSLGAKLFDRVGRRLELTEFGRIVYRYADQIFTLGSELVEVARGRPSGRPMRLSVGVPDFMPKLITYRLLAPVFKLAEPVELFCFESNLDELLGDLAVQRYDLVLSDAPVSSRIKVRAYNHLLGDCGVTIFGTPKLAKQYRRGFPASLQSAPWLLPTENTELRRSLEQWFEKERITPKIVGHIYDSALLKEFGHGGIGLFPAPAAIEREVQRQYGVRVVGRIATVRERFYAITVERQISHPAIAAISTEARCGLLS